MLSHYFLFLSLIPLCFSSLKFDLPINKYKCFLEDISFEATLLIRYDLSFPNITNTNEIIKNVEILVTNDNGVKASNFYLEKRKGKFAVYLKEESIYRICVKYHKSYSIPNPPQGTLMGIKLSTEYEANEPKVEEALQKEEIEIFKKKIKDIKSELDPSVNVQEKEIRNENRTAKKIIKSGRLYYYATIIQLIVVIGVGMYHLINFRRFLSSNKII